MRLIDLILTANGNLWHNKGRTILTVLAIFIGATTLSLTSGIGAGITTYLHQQVGNLGNTNSLIITAATKSSIQTAASTGLSKYVPHEKKISIGAGGGGTLVALTNRDLKRIAAVPNIVSVTPELAVTPDFIAAKSNPTRRYQFTITENIGSERLDMKAGRPVQNAKSGYEITIPVSYLSSLGFSDAQSAVGQAVDIGITSAVGKQSLVVADIVGVQQATLLGSVAAYANSALYRQLYVIQTTGLPKSSKDAYADVIAIMKPGLSAAQVQSLQSVLKAKGYDAETLQDEVGVVFTVINVITYLFDAFAAITLLAAGFGIVNTLYMSVQNRTKEIGLMKAMGMGKRRIFLLFSLEAILIGFWGSVLGIGFANLIGSAVNAAGAHGFLKDFPGLQLLAFPWSSMLIIVVGIMLLAFLAGAMPARRASNKDPIEALRYE